MVLQMDRAELYARLEAACENGRGYLVVKKQAAWEEAGTPAQHGLDWIEIDSGSERHYPNGTLAAHVLGGVDFAEKGNAGMEKALEADLRRGAGRRAGVDGRQAPRPRRAGGTEPKPGAAMTLTIDERLQFVAERELAAAVAGQGRAQRQRGGDEPAERRDSGAGQLSRLTIPTGRRTRTENPAARLNHAISVPFEPGSVFKIITLSAALETTQSAAGKHDRLRPRRHHAVRADDSRGARRLRRHVDGGRAEAFEQHGRHPDRHEGGRSAYARLRAPVRIRAEERAFRCRPNRAAGCAAGAWGKLSLRFDRHGAGGQRDHAATGAGGVGGGQRRIAGAAAAGVETGRPGGTGAGAGARSSSRRPPSPCGR